MWLKINNTTIFTLLYHFNQFDTSRVTGPSVVSKIGPCHRSQRPVLHRFNVWQCRKVKNQLKNRSFYSIYRLFYIFWLSQPSATPNRAQNSRNCQFGPCPVSEFSLCHSHRPFVSKCRTGPTCHSHRGVSNWMKWYSIRLGCCSCVSRNLEGDGSFEGPLFLRASWWHHALTILLRIRLVYVHRSLSPL